MRFEGFFGLSLAQTLCCGFALGILSAYVTLASVYNNGKCNLPLDSRNTRRCGQSMIWGSDSGNVLAMVVPVKTGCWEEDEGSGSWKAQV